MLEFVEKLLDKEIVLEPYMEIDAMGSVIFGFKDEFDKVHPAISFTKEGKVFTHRLPSNFGINLDEINNGERWLKYAFDV